jgi:hypothetical protein
MPDDKERGFKGEGLLFVYKDQIYFIAQNILPQYVVQVGTDAEKKDALQRVKNYISTSADKKRVPAVYSPIFHIMEGAGG